jgi:uncharacterized membrane protein
MSKTVLVILGVIILAVGVLALFVQWAGVKAPLWYGIVEMVVGLFAIYIGLTDQT